jgi:L,D-peptidoglycan transpeptidase YkuD (ErfK/YbiS/YcfS/YnhG family)
VGLFGIGAALYGNGPPIGGAEAYQQLQCGDWWDEDSSSAQYNLLVSVPCGTSPPFGGASEALWQETTAYAHFAVILYNSTPIVSGAGSAIFLHDSVGGPTAGCVALDPAVLDQVLSWMDPADHPEIAIGTASQVGSM